LYLIEFGLDIQMESSKWLLWKK